MRAEPDLDAYHATWAQNYSALNYGRSLSARVLTSTHQLLERDFGPESEFADVLEVGGGDGAHFPAVRHRFRTYLFTDGSDRFLDHARAKIGADNRVRFAREDATKLSFADASFDRLIATHVLEHLPNPHEVLREWTRVVKPGGVLSIILPCDPGMLWRFGRTLGPRRAAERAGLAYDYWMAREHINSIFNLKSLIEYYFPDRKERWWPMRLPAPDINLIYSANIRVAGGE